jgi:hypothetical protein
MVNMPLSRRARRYVFATLYSVAGVWTLWPVASLALTNVMARLLHCRLSEGSPLPCRLFGLDISKQMYIGAVAFWYALTTLPTGIAALITIATIHAVLHVVDRLTQKKQQDPLREYPPR